MYRQWLRVGSSECTFDSPDRKVKNVSVVARRMVRHLLHCSLNGSNANVKLRWIIVRWLLVSVENGINGVYELQERRVGVNLPGPKGSCLVVIDQDDFVRATWNGKTAEVNPLGIKRNPKLCENGVLTK